MNKAEYIKQYNKKYTKRVSLILSKEKDKDIISAIETEGKGNIQAGVKSLIRRAINNNEG
jgi:hypothetical protein